LTLLSGGGGAAAEESDIPTTDLEAWWRKGTGITHVANAVSQWDDQSGNARHLAQASAGAKPALQGDGTLLFDDSYTKFMKVVFTIAQPVTLYIRFKQLTWISGFRMADGGTTNAMLISQFGSTPALLVSAGASALSNSGMTLNTYKTYSLVLNGASSSSKVSGAAKVTGDPGALAPDGFTIGARADGNSPSNIQVAEIAIYGAAHDDTVRGEIETYFDTVI
jgi:hypothetical protein